MSGAEVHNHSNFVQIFYLIPTTTESKQLEKRLIENRPKMSDNNQECKSKKSLVAKNDKNMKRYSESEKTLLYELFERYQEIIDIKLRRNLYSSTKQCEVRECWELILKTFNDDQRTSKRTLKQLQKFWLNAK